MSIGGYLAQVSAVFPDLERVCIVCVRPHSRVLQELIKFYDVPEHHDTKLSFTGHSLGGGLSLIAFLKALSEPRLQALALSHDVSVYTFGSPRVLYQV